MSTQPQSDNTQGAKDAARRTLEHIVEIMEAIDQVEEFETVTFESYEHTRESLLDMVQEMPLSIEVRSGWHTPGSIDDAGAAEYKVLMSWGGPSVQIVGDISEHGEPENAQIQGQDWFVEWQGINVSVHEDARLLDFVSAFYFGE